VGVRFAGFGVEVAGVLAGVAILQYERRAITGFKKLLVHSSTTEMAYISSPFEMVY
jgi:hypothetical protein